MVRLPYAVKDMFKNWLEENYPHKMDKVLERIRSMRGGKLNQYEFGKRFKGEGIWADSIRMLFEMSLSNNGLKSTMQAINVDYFRKPNAPPEQLELF